MLRDQSLCTPISLCLCTHLLITMLFSCPVSSIPEDTAVGTVVGELAADDVDKGQTLRYTMGRNAFFVVSGNKILVDGRLDFETSPHATLEIQVTDSGTPPKSVSS